MKNYFKKIKILSVIILLFIISPSFVFAASIFTSPQNTEVRVGDTFTISVNVNSQGQFINASSLDLKYDPSFLSVQGIGKASSIFTLWSEEPTISSSNGIIHLSGGLASPGWNGGSGNIIRITFKAKSTGQTSIKPQNASVLANDGIGTNVLNSVQETNITIKEALVVPKVEKKQEIKKEIEKAEEQEELLPESFEIPVIINLPDILNENDELSFEGIGLPNGEVQVYFQKGKGVIEIVQLNTDSDGKFYAKYKNFVSSGFYRVWVKNLSKEGVLGTSSETYYVEVIGKSAINLFGTKIYYKDLTIISIILLVIAIIIIMLLSKSYFDIKDTKKTKKRIKNIIRDISI